VIAKQVMAKQGFYALTRMESLLGYIGAPFSPSKCDCDQVDAAMSMNNRRFLPLAARWTNSSELEERRCRSRMVRCSCVPCRRPVAPASPRMEAMAVTAGSLLDQLRDRMEADVFGAENAARWRLLRTPWRYAACYSSPRCEGAACSTGCAVG
jgi:hypothetical protein